MLANTRKQEYKRRPQTLASNCPVQYKWRVGRQCCTKSFLRPCPGESTRTHWRSRPSPWLQLWPISGCKIINNVCLTGVFYFTLIKDSKWMQHCSYTGCRISSIGVAQYNPYTIVIIHCRYAHKPSHFANGEGEIHLAKENWNTFAKLAKVNCLPNLCSCEQFCSYISHVNINVNFCSRLRRSIYWH